MAWWNARPVSRSPALDHSPETGSYNSAALSSGSPESRSPPTTRILPSFKEVAVWNAWALEVEPVGVHVSSAGSYISAVLTADAAMPPTSRTRPSPRLVAVCPPLSDRRSGPSVQEPDAGSNISTLFIRPALSSPPATSTRPSWRRVAVWSVLAWRIARIGDQVSVEGS